MGWGDGMVGCWVEGEGREWEGRREGDMDCWAEAVGDMMGF